MLEIKFNALWISQAAAAELFCVHLDWSKGAAQQLLQQALAGGGSAYLTVHVAEYLSFRECLLAHLKERWKAQRVFSSSVPACYKFWAADKDGRAYYYEQEPRMLPGDSAFTRPHGSSANAVQPAGYTPWPQEPWQESLVRRSALEQTVQLSLGDDSTATPAVSVTPDAVWKVEPHTTTDKWFPIIGPGGFELRVDYDDVDHADVDRKAENMVSALNLELAMRKLFSQKATA